MAYQAIFERLWKDYIRRNPNAHKVYQLFTKHGEHVINDHIAFRTFNDPRVNVDQLAKVFIAQGYEEKGQYDFPVKKLFAKHYEHKDLEAPKVFISELLTEKFSPRLQELVKTCIDKIPKNSLNPAELIFAGTCWEPLSYKVYQELLQETEYAAWMYAFGYCANHFTVNANALKNFKEIHEINTFLKEHGFVLNTGGGEVKGTPQEYLEQSSTMAEEIPVKFNEGTYPIPSCYYEFAKRYKLPNGKLYTGFVAASADKIFESTNVKK